MVWWQPSFFIVYILMVCTANQLVRLWKEKTNRWELLIRRYIVTYQLAFVVIRYCWQWLIMRTNLNVEFQIKMHQTLNIDSWLYSPANTLTPTYHKNCLFVQCFFHPANLFCFIHQNGIESEMDYSLFIPLLPSHFSLIWLIHNSNRILKKLKRTIS